MKNRIVSFLAGLALVMMSVLVASPAQAVPPGHDCQQLYNNGMSFNSMWDYWISIGSPSDMDNDKNGIPCETIYGAYGQKNNTTGGGNAGLPTGHDCSQLAAAGFSFSDVWAYWYRIGAPADMDVDFDGIPCETVYGQH